MNGSIFVTILWFKVGIIVDIFALVWIIGFWVKAPFTKWKNQHEKLKKKK